MNEFNTYEFVVAQKHEGKVRLFRILAVVSYVLFFCVVAAALILLHFPWNRFASRGISPFRVRQRDTLVTTVMGL